MAITKLVKEIEELKICLVCCEPAPTVVKWCQPVLSDVASSS